MLPVLLSTYIYGYILNLHVIVAMARNIMIVGLGERCINLVVEEDISVGCLKEKISQREVR